MENCNLMLCKADIVWTLINLIYHIFPPFPVSYSGFFINIDGKSILWDKSLK